MAAPPAIAGVALLLRAKASVLARTQGGATPLMRAAFAGHAAVVAQLMRAGSAVEAQDSDGDTALHKAAAQGHGDLYAELAKASDESAAKLRNRKGRLASELLPGESNGAG